MNKKRITDDDKRIYLWVTTLWIIIVMAVSEFVLLSVFLDGVFVDFVSPE